MTSNYQMAPPPPQPMTGPAQRDFNKVSVAAVACSGVGAFLFFPLLLVGFVLGVVGVVQCRQRRERGLGLAVTAIVIALLAGGFTMAMLLLFALGGAP